MVAVNEMPAKAGSLVEAWLREWRRVKADAEEWMPEPSFKELKKAADLIHVHGLDACLEYIPELCRLLKDRWYECKNFAGATRYWDDAVRIAEAQKNPPPPDPAVELAAEWHKQWFQSVPARIPPADVEYARRLIAEFGESRLRSAIPTIVATMRRNFPNARTFLAIENYLHDALFRVSRDAGLSLAAREAAEGRAKEAEEVKVNPEMVRAGELWRAMSEEERESVRAVVRKKYPHIVRFGSLFEVRCLEELANRSKTEGKS